MKWTKICAITLLSGTVACTATPPQAPAQSSERPRYHQPGTITSRPYYGTPKPQSKQQNAVPSNTGNTPTP